MKKTYLLSIFLVFYSIVFVFPGDTFIFKDIEPGRIFLLDNQGDIFVDYDENKIFHYSPTGKFVCEIGRKGEGPGDIKRMGWFAINPLDDLVYVTEFLDGNRWISKFSKDGKYMGDWKCEMDWMSYSGLSMIKFDSIGNAYIETTKSHSRRYKDFMLGTVENIVIKFSPQGKKLKELYRFRTDFDADKGGKGNITIPFHNYLYWTIFGNKIIIRESNDDFISLFDTDGNLEKKIPLPFKREKVKEKDLDEWEAWIKSTPFGKRGIMGGWLDLKYWRSRLPFPKYKPVSGHQLFYDSRGNLYSSKYGSYQSSSTTWARINLNDYKTSIVEFKLDDIILCTWKNYFFFGRYDSDGNYIVLRIEEKDVFPMIKKNGK